MEDVKWGLNKKQNSKLGYGVIGNTADSGPAFPGSSPGTPTEFIGALWVELLFLCPYVNCGFLVG